MILVKELQKKYVAGADNVTVALHVPYLKIADGAQLAVVGPSGSGKSTLLQCLAGIITPTAGDIWIGEDNVKTWSEKKKAQWRGANLGYIFQELNLLPSLTVMDNIVAGLYFAGKSITGKRRRWIAELLQLVGLAGFEEKLPQTMSIGEQQRVAVVRALAKTPTVIFADEPTASLDSENSLLVIRLYKITASRKMQSA